MSFLKIILCFLFISFVATTAYAETIERIAAVAGDEVITLNDVRHEGVLRYAVKGRDLRDIDISTQRADDLEALTKELVQTRLIAREARKSGISVGNREVDMQLEQMYRQSGQSEETYKRMMAQEGIAWNDYRAYIRSEIEKQFVIRNELAGQVAPAESDVIACAQEKAPDAQNSVTATLRQIIIPELSGDSSAGLSTHAAKNLNAVWWDTLDSALEVYATGVQEIVAKNPDNFVQYVKMYSSGRSMERDGLLGSFSPSDLSKDFAPVFALQKGEISNVISTAAGYHIIHVDDVVYGESEAWKKTMEQCRENIMMRESQRLVDSWLNDLLEKNFVSILVNRDIVGVSR